MRASSSGAVRAWSSVLIGTLVALVMPSSARAALQVPVHASAQVSVEPCLAHCASRLEAQRAPWREMKSAPRREAKSAPRRDAKSAPQRDVELAAQLGSRAPSRDALCANAASERVGLVDAAARDAADGDASTAPGASKVARAWSALRSIAATWPPEPATAATSGIDASTSSAATSSAARPARRTAADALADAAFDAWLDAPRVERDLWLIGCARAEAAAADRHTALYVLSELGGSSDVSLYCAIGDRAIEQGDERAEESVEGAIHAWLVRAPAAYAELPAALQHATPELRCSVCAGVARIGTSRALDFLTDRLGTSEAEDRVILGFVGAAVGGPIDGVPARCTKRMLSALESRDPSLRREAALALGRIEDPDALEALTALLDSNERSDRTAALWALRQTTGLAFQASSATWRAWLEQEQRYWDERGDEQLGLLAGMNRKQQADALRELGEHRWRRADIARGVAPLLRCDDAKVARLASLVLTDLGGSVVRALIQASAPEAVEDVSDPLREALQRVLPIAPRVAKRQRVVGAHGSSSRTRADR